MKNAGEGTYPPRILVVAAHPHHFTHCAGTCGIHTSRGDSVTVVCVTDGVNIHNERLHDELMRPEEDRDANIVNQTAQEYAEMKANEVREVCDLFRVADVRMLAFTQSFRLDKVPEAVETWRDIIYDVRPDLLITHRPYLSGPHGMDTAAQDDHNEVAFAVHEGGNPGGDARRCDQA